MTTERAFRAMGTDCRVLVFGDASASLAALAEQRVALLEQCWTRFRPDSELNRLNRRAGTGPVPVSADLALLVEAMVAAWRWTDGHFDATVLQTMQDLGYDADFATVIARDAVAAVMPRALVGMDGIEVHDELVTLPSGLGVDPGAIGKGLAGDIVVDDLMQAGARGVLVDLGGDVVLAGQPDADEWAIDIVDERDGSTFTTVTWQAPVDHLAIATSSTLRRRWADGRHHVVDPRTGDVARGDLVQATVIATDGWQAEAAATCALVLGSSKGRDWLTARDLQGFLITSDQLVEA